MMLTNFHFLRPEWFFAFLPLLVCWFFLGRRQRQQQAWSTICDPHLLAHLVRDVGKSKRQAASFSLFISIFCVIVSLAGPCWSKFPVPTYHSIIPRVIVLDMSDAMLAHDLAPDRFTRAKFKLHDLLTREENIGQLGLVVFTDEPFIVSPLTDDAKTIDVLLQSLTLDAMPVNGYRLDLALNQAAQLIVQAGFNQGQILVLTAETPNVSAIDKAAMLSRDGMNISVIPIRAKTTVTNPLFERLAEAGGGMVTPLSDNRDDLDAWLQLKTRQHTDYLREHENLPVWRDEGRWFLIPALLFMLPVFRRGWLQRVVL